MVATELRLAHRGSGSIRGREPVAKRMTWTINTYQLSDLFGGERHRPTPLALSLGMSPQLRGIAQMAYTSNPDIGGLDPFRASAGRPTGVEGSLAWSFGDIDLPLTTLTLVTLPCDLASLRGDARLDVIDQAMDDLRDLPELRAAVAKAVAKHAVDRGDSDLEDILAYARGAGAHGISARGWT